MSTPPVELHGPEHTPLPAVELQTSTNSTVFRLLECLILVFVLPAAIALYVVLRLKLPTPMVWTVIGLPIIHFILVALVLLVYTPRQYITTMFLALELAVVMLGATIYDYAVLREWMWFTASLSNWWIVSGTPVCIVGLGVACYVFWHFTIHAFLSVKGVKLKEMGCMGDINGVVFGGIRKLWVGGLRTLSGCVIGCETLGCDEEASPPSYHVSCLLYISLNSWRFPP